MSSQLVGSFNPANVDPVTLVGKANVVIPQGHLRLYNESIFGLLITMADGEQFYSPAGARRTICVNQSSGNITYQQVSKLNVSSASATLQIVTIETIDPGDTFIPEDLHTLAGGVGGASSNGSNAIQEFQSSFVNSFPLDISLAGHSGSAVLGASPPFPNMSQVSVQQPAFLFMGYLDLSVARELILPYRNGFREGVQISPNVTVPNGGNTQTFQLSGSQAITSVAFLWAGIPNVSVAQINIDRNDGIFQTVPITALASSGGNTVYKLDMYGPYGFESYAPAAGGLRVQIQFNNTSGASQSFFIVVTGSRFAFDDARLVVTFTDWATPSTTWTLALVRLDDVRIIPLNFLVPTPVTNPSLPNFGTLTVQVITVTEFYATKYFGNVYTVDFVIPAALIFAAPV